MKIPAITFILASLAWSSSHAVTLFQIETFEDGNSWTRPAKNPNQPVVGPDGPQGGSDAALRISSQGGDGPGSRLVAFSTTLWAGDYHGQGITGLQLDLKSLSTSTLEIHLALNGPGGWFVSEGLSLPRFRPWDTYSIDLTAGSMNPAGGSDYLATLADVTQARIYHTTNDSSHRGKAVQGALLIDNIKAVPEPSCLTTLLLGLGFFRKRKT